MLNVNNEKWVKLKDFENTYEISNTGKIRNISTYHKKFFHKEKAQNARSKTCIYMHVNLSKHGKVITKPVHRLVAISFVDNPNNKPMVNHIDGNKLNNNAYNLEWVTCSENHKHAFKTGLRIQTKIWLGKKFSTTSKYHNVGRDHTRKKWLASIKINGKSKTKRFDIEIDAAKQVNDWIDFYNLTDRPKNIIN